MASNEQSVTLLRMNKRAQVEALRSLGFDLDETARASEFPAMVKWAAGLLDLTIAANRKSDNRKCFFTPEEWVGLSYTEQSNFLLRGVRVRAWGKSFIIAPDNITDKQWGANITVADAHYYSASKDAFTYWDAEAENTAIVESLSGKAGSNGITGAPAAESAMAYKAFTLERDGLEDDSRWLLPTYAHLNLMYHFRTEIDAVFALVWSASCKFINKLYWTCNNWDLTQCYRGNFDTGEFYVSNQTDFGTVRPITLS